jgi:hypothetical protein
MLDPLQRGRECYRRRSLKEAYDLLAAADQGEPLAANDLELIATSAYLTGRDLEFHRLLKRLHGVLLKIGRDVSPPAPSLAAVFSRWKRRRSQAKNLPPRNTRKPQKEPFSR